jgi:heme/copper-type cytochrome/quinol oxidase subunit 2
VLVALAVALVAAFVVAPPTLAASGPDGGFVDRRGLTEALRDAFVDYWRSGDRDFPPGLERLVDYWFRYHVAKAVIAAILLIVLAALGVLLWKAFLRAGGLGARGRAALASAGVLVTMLAVLSSATVMANVQGAVAPFASLLPMLAVGDADGELADTLDQVRQRLADSASGGDLAPPALEVMVNDFSRYHVAMAVIAAIVAVVLIGVSAVSWKSFAATGSSDRRTRRVWGLFGVFSALSSLVVIVVAVANTTTAADPAPALLAFFDGGW